MEYRWITVSSLINTITHTDTLFQGTHTIDPYQGCSFRCTYCDSSFQETVEIKTNAVDILQQELTQMTTPRIIIGSVHDPYQPVEQQTQLTRNIIEVLHIQHISCHILTKSPLILRDIDVLKKFSDLQVTISFCSFHPQTAKHIEPYAPSISKRMETIQHLIQEHITVNIAYMPFLPGISDQEIHHIPSMVQPLQFHRFIIKPLELKGRQKQQFLASVIQPMYPTLLPLYEKMYANSLIPPRHYTEKMMQQVKEVLKEKLR